MRQTFFFIALLILQGSCFGQNVRGYSSIAEPLLFLLREPAVHTELNLSDQQLSKLIELNQQHDAALLASRNRPPEKSDKQTSKVLDATRAAISEILNDQQRERLNQIRYRLRGISFVLAPEVVAKLKLTDHQQQQISTIVEKAKKSIANLQDEINEGKKTNAEAQKEGKQIRTLEQTQIVGLLDAKQKSDLVSVVGKNFDINRLGNVSFKAPEISSTGEWINSGPLSLSKLKGKVVALHFWAFG